MFTDLERSIQEPGIECGIKKYIGHHVAFMRAEAVPLFDVREHLLCPFALKQWPDITGVLSDISHRHLWGEGLAWECLAVFHNRNVELSGIAGHDGSLFGYCAMDHPALDDVLAGLDV